MVMWCTQQTGLHLDSGFTGKRPTNRDTLITIAVFQLQYIVRKCRFVLCMSLYIILFSCTLSTYSDTSGLLQTEHLTKGNKQEKVYNNLHVTQTK